MNKVQGARYWTGGRQKATFGTRAPTSPALVPQKGSNRNIRAHAFVHSTSVSADGTQEGEIAQEGELVHLVKFRRNIMG